MHLHKLECSNDIKECDIYASTLYSKAKRVCAVGYANQLIHLWGWVKSNASLRPP